MARVALILTLLLVVVPLSITMGTVATLDWREARRDARVARSRHKRSDRLMSALSSGEAIRAFGCAVVLAALAVIMVVSVVHG